MNQVKNAVILPYVLLTILLSIYSLWSLCYTFHISWVASLLANGSMASFFLFIAFGKPARVNPLLPLQLLSISISCIILIFHASWMPVLLTLGPGLMGYLAFVFWHSKLNRDTPNIIIGKPLPDFNLTAIDNSIISNETLKGKITLMLFIRGNWCPLCVAQVKEIASQYQSLADMGVQTLFISPQNQQESIILSRRFKIPGIFASDNDFECAQALGIKHEHGSPKLTNHNQTDTIYPTIIILDKNGSVIWFDATNNYLVRPEPIQFIPIIEKLSQS